jgi:hypothetical protein
MTESYAGTKRGVPCHVLDANADVLPLFTAPLSPGVASVPRLAAEAPGLEDTMEQPFH